MPRFHVASPWPIISFGAAPDAPSPALAALTGGLDDLGFGAAPSPARAAHRDSMDDFLVDGEKLGSNEGDRTLVVFRDAGTVVLAAAKNGQTFGPSVLAPKAHVVRDAARTRTEP